MASLANGNLGALRTLQQSINVETTQLTSAVLLDVVEGCLHGSTSEWIFLRELRVGTGFHGNAAQRLDAYALNCLPHTSMRRVCYEVKTSRADFFCEMKQPLKRRIGLRYSNEFYFVTPAGLLNTSELPIECGLVEIGAFAQDERSIIHAQLEALAHFDPDHEMYCRVTVQLRGEKLPPRHGNLWLACCETSRKCFTAGHPSRRSKDACRSRIEDQTLKVRRPRSFLVPKSALTASAKAGWNPMQVNRIPPRSGTLRSDVERSLGVRSKHAPLDNTRFSFSGAWPLNCSSLL